MKHLLTPFRAAAIVFLLTQAATAAHAMNPVPVIPSCPDPSGTPTGAPTGAPIDGGASFLLASGAAYAVRRIRKAKK
jgi:hypothetical protein